MRRKRQETTLLTGTRWRGLRALVLVLAALLGAARTEAALQLAGRDADEPVPLSRPTATRQPAAASAASLPLERTLALGGLIAASGAIAYKLLRRFAPGLVPAPAPRALDVIAQCPLGARGSLYLVRCGPRLLVVGATAQQLTTLSELADPDEIDQVLELLRPAGAQDARPSPDATPGEMPELRARVNGLREKIQSWKRVS